MKIAVLTSGGVDSSVALKLLQEQGHDVTAFYLKIWLEDELAFLSSCPWEEDLAYLREICGKSKIPLEIVPMQKEYWANIVSYSLREIKAGRTPNSDLLCNSKVKFGKFYEKIDKSFQLVATGHYAGKEEKDGHVFLKKAKDSFKDQTYFLADLNVKQLKRACFPIGNYLKTEVREIATRFNLPNQNRKDSQGICFLGKIKYHEFIRAHLGEKEGDLIEFETGKMLGRHPGYWFYTIGQRQRIGLSGGPWFVVKKDIKKNIVYISKRYLENDQKRDSFKVTKFHWINSKPSPKHELGVKVRHGEKIYSARLKMTGKDIGEIHIDGCDQGFAAGQFAVFYTGDCCLGCATITN